jgi:uncharacterized protein YjaG (DUF416 family)
MVNQVSTETMRRIKSLQEKITPSFIDYCNLNGIDLSKWYRWQLHLIWQRRKDHRILEKQKTQEVC